MRQGGVRAAGLALSPLPQAVMRTVIRCCRAVAAVGGARHSASRRARLARLPGLALIVALATARGALAQGGQPRAAAPAPPAPEAKAARPAPAGALPVQWWCEVNAQPARGAQLSLEESTQNFFMSQVIARPPRGGPDERRTVERICRTAFEVTFGSRWELITARAQQAATPQAAQAGRRTDMRLGNHLGHVQDFHIPG